MLRTTSLSNQNLCTTWNVPAGPRTVTTEAATTPRAVRVLVAPNR